MDDPERDWWGLMIPHCLSKQGCELTIDGVRMKFLYAPNGIKVILHGTFQIHCSSLTRTAGGLRSLYGLGELLL